VTVADIFNFENIIKVIMFIGSDDRYRKNLYSDVSCLGKWCWHYLMLFMSLK